MTYRQVVLGLRYPDKECFASTGRRGLSLLNLCGEQTQLVNSYNYLRNLITAGGGIVEIRSRIGKNQDGFREPVTLVPPPSFKGKEYNTTVYNVLYSC